jgi:hypothetical protein
MTDSKAVEVLAEALTDIDMCEPDCADYGANTLMEELKTKGYSILPTATDERLREAVEFLTFYKQRRGECVKKTLSIEYHFDSIDPETNESALARYMRHMGEIEAALAELAELRAASQWRPIESAPRDGREHTRTNVLVYHSQSKMTAVAYCNHYGEWRHIDGAEIHAPTHWMPLPTPPKEASNE